MLPTATVEHAMDGRLRVRIPERRGDASYFEDAIRKLSANPAITRLEANPLTGSLLIGHRADPATLGEIAADAGVFLLQALLPQVVHETTRSRASARTVGFSLPRSGPAAGLGLLGLSAYAAAQGNVVGPASENFWHALGALRILNNSRLALALVAVGMVQLARGHVTGSTVSLALYALHVMNIPDSAFRPDRARSGPAGHREATTPQVRAAAHPVP